MTLVSILLACVPAASAHDPGNVIFIHPDGTGLGHWNAARHYFVGPDGMLNWDRMERLAAYRPHQKNWLSTTSHAGATTHAYGRKVHYESFGLDHGEPLLSVSGKNMSIMEEAMAAGVRVGVINTGHVGEPGSAAFLSRTEHRNVVEDIAPQVLGSGADVIFCGGEIYMLPVGVMGRHGQEGRREDGRDLLSEARARGYTVIHNREELLSLSPEVRRVIGVFAAKDTYNILSEAKLRERGLESYDPQAPSFDEMVRVALEILSRNPDERFFLVAEEEGTDNFSNAQNASGMLDAIGRADRAIGTAMDFLNRNTYRNTLLLVAADSDAGSPGVWSPKVWDKDYLLPETTRTGAQLDGAEGQGGKPFWSQPDSFGNRYPFGIFWGSEGEHPGSSVIKAHGFRSDLLWSSIDNTRIYRIMYEVLFGYPPISRKP